MRQETHPPVQNLSPKNTNAQVESVYRWYAKYYDYARKVWNPFLAASAEKEFERLLTEYIQAGAEILDIGVGTGLNIERILKNKIPFGSYEGIDLTPEMLTVARKKFDHLKNLTLRTGDITTLEITKKYDVIISTLVFSHLNRQDEVVQKLLAALKPNGVILLLFFSAKPTSNVFDKLALKIYRSIFKFDHVPVEVVKKFPPSKVEQHFHCLGGQMSIYVFTASMW